ncbi:MAG TPA: glycosyltransferase family 4 protein [Usitatibacter sp.]|nr:glycosyltransferase family 4 protein [Usitatibacter sp.]
MDRSPLDPGETGSPLRIAVVSPLHESVPPRLYGGTERVVSYLTEELVRLGHDVTLFATGDSRTHAKLQAMAPRGLRLDPDCRDPLAHHVAMVHDVVELADEFDVVHFHIDYVHFPSARHANLPSLTTLHGRLDIPDLVPVFRRYPDMRLVSISDAQRKPLPWASWIGTVHHGLPRQLLAPGAGGGGYLAFLGRVSPEKRLDRAIRIAQRVGLPLRIAAKIEKIDLAYYESVVKPMLALPGVEFVGEIGERDKAAFLGNAAALLFPIDWPEPFGLVMIESLACATPVLAFDRGSVREVIEPGTGGWIVASEDEAVAALARLGDIDRAACRRSFEERFTSERMARDYLRLYARVAHLPRRSPSVRRAAA